MYLILLLVLLLQIHDDSPCLENTYDKMISLISIQSICYI